MAGRQAVTASQPRSALRCVDLAHVRDPVKSQLRSWNSIRRIRRRTRTYDRSVPGCLDAALDLGPQRASLGLAWLAGLLEAEGTFLKPAPSAPRLPIVACRMTDRDVIERVAIAFGTSVHCVDKGRYRTEYGARIKGSRAVSLMQDLRPIMSDRRRAAIDGALSAHSPPQRKLDFHLAEDIRRRYEGGETITSLARLFDVSRPTIRSVLYHRIYPDPAPTPWRGSVYLPDLWLPPSRLSPVEFVWLAGWLEGEGSFLAPPPSSPKLPRISAHSRDHDVMREVGRLLGVKAVRGRDRRAAVRGWSPLWRVLKQGRGAVALMLALLPLMSARRQAQIRRAITENQPGRSRT